MSTVNTTSIRLFFLGDYDSRRGYGHSFSMWSTGWFYAAQVGEEVHFLWVYDDTNGQWHERWGEDVFTRLHPLPPRDRWEERENLDSIPRRVRRYVGKRFGVDLSTAKDAEADARAEARRKAEAEAEAEAKAEAEARRQAEAKAYGRACGQAARAHGLPFEVVLAVGPDLAPELAEIAKAITSRGLLVSGFTHHELTTCGIDRRKAAIRRVIGACSEELSAKIDGMGQAHSQRLAHYLSSICC